MGYVTVAQKVKAMLDAISSSTLALKFQYNESTPTSFPAGMMLPPTFPSEDFTDSAYNTVTMVFPIRVLFPEEESSASYEKWLNFLDALHTELRDGDNRTLDGNAVSVKTLGTSHGFTNDGQGNLIFFDTQVEVKMLQSI